MWRLLPLLAVAAALEPAVVSDSQAHQEHDYLRRQPACAEAGDATLTPAVPRVLHQMWWQGEADLPKHYAPLRASWKETHKKWKVKMWDEKSATKLINSSYPWFAGTFQALPSKIQKADAARYAILHAEGGVYADMDVEAFLPLDDVLAPRGAAPTAHLFEEPATHWDMHGTVISNGMMSAPPQHPLLLAVLRSIRPVAAVFASGGSKMLQGALAKCAEEEEEAQTGERPCGCYVTHSSENFFPLHEAMRQPVEFKNSQEHADAARALIEDLGSKSWPLKTAYTAQHWTASWIDAERGKFWIEGLMAARKKKAEEAEVLLLAVVMSNWGHKFKYANAPDKPNPSRAKAAFERALHWRPDYGFAYYELGNIALEASQAEQPGSAEFDKQLGKAAGHFKEAVKLQPDSLLFVNNLGVALMNQGKAREAMERFRKVLELNLKSTSFVAIKGLDPEAGALLNIGHALHTLGEREEAHGYWVAALRVGNYEHASQAVKRLKADDATHALPNSALVDMILGEALEKDGRVREAALRYASAHLDAHNMTSADAENNFGETPASVRQKVKERMLALSEVWEEGEGALADSPSRGAKPPPSKVQVVEAGADGTMKRTDMTHEEMMASFKAAQQQASPMGSGPH